MDNFIDQGFNNFYISTHFLAEKIVDFFGDGTLKGVSIEYIHEKTYGNCWIIRTIAQEKIDSPIIMMNGDLLSKVNFQTLVIIMINPEKSPCVSLNMNFKCLMA